MSSDTDTDTKAMSVDTEAVSSNPSIANSTSPNSSASTTSSSKDNKTKKKSRKRKLEATDINNSSSSSGAPPKKKRRKKRGWSEEEESLFIEGLSLHGRNWKQVAAHVGHNRDAPSIRSHAQIYFLRCLQNRVALAPRILESGNGFTLSGKPLNKYSSIAIRHFGSADKVPIVDGVISDSESAASLKRPKNNDKKKTKSNAKKSKAKKKKRNKYYDSDSEEEYTVIASAAHHDNENTAAVKRRSGRKRSKLIPVEAPHISNPFGLRTDIEIYDAMKQENEEEQECRTANDRKKKRRFTDNKVYAPFIVKYCPNALLVADMHSHLLRCVEIMGYLAGTYDAETRELVIKKCYPLNEEEQGEETVSACDLDILRVSEKIKEDGLKLVGWYHSHPCFDNIPSNMDCHQHSIHKYPNEEKQPYVGLIVQSLWNRGSYSHWRFFNTNSNSLHSYSADCQYVVMEFEAERKKSYDANDAELFQQIEALVERYTGAKYDIYRTDFGDEGIETKLLQNIRWHSEIEGNKDEFINKVRELFVKKSHIWWVTNRPDTNKENQNCLN